MQERQFLIQTLRRQVRSIRSILFVNWLRRWRVELWRLYLYWGAIQRTLHRQISILRRILAKQGEAFILGWTWTKQQRFAHGTSRRRTIWNPGTMRVLSMAQLQLFNR